MGAYAVHPAGYHQVLRGPVQKHQTPRRVFPCAPAGTGGSVGSDGDGLLMCSAAKLAVSTAAIGGPRVFVFVVESELDPAVAALQDMMQQYPRCSRQQDQMDHSKQHCNSAPDPQQQQQQQQHQVIECWQDGPQHQVMLVTAGLTTSCSQKIHK